MSNDSYLKEIEEVLKIPDIMANLEPENAISLKKQKPSSLRSLLISESSMGQRDVDSIIYEDLPEHVMKEFHPPLTSSEDSSE
ncbi:MAG: hypothetical protein K8T10_15545 [Candidatus Eremiobacteraeota bacterium]|nr:hypothetical protein [Candidatus Eremiobacteraeota bacterium]